MKRIIPSDGSQTYGVIAESEEDASNKCFQTGKLIREELKITKNKCGFCNYAYNGVDDINTYCLKNGDKLIHEGGEACDDFVGMK